MATIPQITLISIHHGKAARVVEFAIASKTLKTITPKTITIR